MAAFNINTIVVWTIPQVIQASIGDYDGVNVYRAGYEDGTYTQVNTALVPITDTTYEDTTVPAAAKSAYYYLVKFHITTPPGETTYYQATTALSPRELRLGSYMRGMLSPFLSCMLTDADIGYGLGYGLKIFNEVPVQTYFTISDLPETLEPMVLILSGMFAFFQKYVPIAMTDIGYSDNGLVLTVDRGAKVKQAIDTLQAFMDKYITKMKWNYLEMGHAVGSMPLPLSIGGKMSSSILSILDIFSTTGR